MVLFDELEDVTSNWFWLTLPGSPGRIGWWTAEVVSLFIAALMYFALGTVIIFLVSLTRLPYAAGLSQYATGLSTYEQRLGIMTFPEGANPLLLCGLCASQLLCAITFGSIASGMEYGVV